MGRDLKSCPSVKGVRGKDDDAHTPGKQKVVQLVGLKPRSSSVGRQESGRPGEEASRRTWKSVNPQTCGFLRLMIMPIRLASRC